MSWKQELRRKNNDRAMTWSSQCLKCSLSSRLRTEFLSQTPRVQTLAVLPTCLWPWQVTWCTKILGWLFLFKILLGASKPTAERTATTVQGERKGEQRRSRPSQQVWGKQDARSEDESKSYRMTEIFVWRIWIGNPTKMPGTHQDFRAHTLQLSTWDHLPLAIQLLQHYTGHLTC